ncbi:GPI transamidase component PIG-T [Madurella fahalii]|uniref:GPI transamidase component PIG-T n=1 Tax=Madurella fahalii TaxID=1157608 RepID=A0ABQ0G5Z0_9PEZI
MAVITPILSILFLLFTPILANTEKTIFLAPESIPIPSARSLLSDLHLDILNPANGTLRTRLAAQFPTDAHPLGTATWFILDALTPNQRYEVRVCWAAAQPTEFSLETFPLATVRDTPELMASLHAYSTSRRDRAQRQAVKDSNTAPNEREASVLLLRILAAADYFTTDASLMSNVPPVDVDIILDPFLFNVLPRSIAGTACYIVGVAIAAYFLAGQIVTWIQGLIDADKKQQRDEKKRQ